MHPDDLLAAEAVARARGAAVLAEYVAYLEAEHDRILAEAAEREAELEAELNEARHQAHLLGALVQEMRNRRSYRLVAMAGSVAAPARALLVRARRSRQRP